MRTSALAPLVLALGLCMMALPSYAETHASSTPSSAEITALPHLDSLKNASSTAALKTPEVQAFTTSTGTRVLFVAAPELPIIDLRLIFDAGSARDGEQTPGQYGLATLTAQLLDEGTNSQTTDQIAANFERLGIDYSASATRDMFVVSMRSLVDPSLMNPGVDQLLSLLKDAQFPQASFDRVLQQNRLGLEQQKESPGTITAIRFLEKLYGTHPYAEPTSGTPESLNRIKPADLKRFKDSYLVAHNLTIAIVGQLSLSDARALAERITQSLPQGQAAKPLPTPATFTAQNVYVPFDSTQTHVMMGAIGVRRDNPDLPALMVANDIFGGGNFSALLMKELREKRGLTYGAYSTFSPLQTNGPFIISYSTRSEKTDESLQVARQVLTDYLHQGTDQRTFEEAKTGLLNSYPLSLSGNNTIAARIANMAFYHLPLTYMADYPKQIEAVTPDSARTAFATYVHPDQMLTLVLGKTAPTSQPTTTNQAPAQGTVTSAKLSANPAPASTQTQHP